MRWKVCGLKNYTNINEVAKFMPDYMGFIFYPKSPRYVGENFHLPLVSEKIKKVGVFVNEPMDFVVQTVRNYSLDYAQLHGEEDAKYIQELRMKGLRLIKAVSVETKKDFAGLENLEVDFFIFDTKIKGARGGTGLKFNWNIIPKNFSKPFLIAGGLSVEDLDNEFNHPQLRGWDFNSKLEIEPGLKDLAKVEALSKAINKKRRWIN